MNPLAADASAAAMLEGVRRALLARPSAAVRRMDATSVLTAIVESATERARALPPRLPGTGERLDRTA